MLHICTISCSDHGSQADSCFQAAILPSILNFIRRIVEIVSYGTTLKLVVECFGSWNDVYFTLVLPMAAVTASLAMTV